MRDEHFKFHKVGRDIIQARWKRLYDFAANLFRKLHTKFYQNHPSFVEDIARNILVFFSGTVYTYAYVVLMRSRCCTWVGTSSPVSFWRRKVSTCQSLSTELMVSTSRFHRRLSLFRMSKTTSVGITITTLLMLLSLSCHPQHPLLLR